MYGPHTADLVDSYVAEDDVMADARSAANVLGCVPISPGVGSALRFLACAVKARAVVEVGTGTGLSGLWLLRGMRPDGVLTALDGDPAELRAARRAFTDAGVPTGRTRLIFGTPAEVLPRLSSANYDLVTCSGPPTDYVPHLPGLLGLVRRGGSLLCHGLLSDGRIADRSARDPQSVAWRELVRKVREDETLTSAVLPIGAGLLVATRRS
jgi:predicted O-methyltransferase YrrM